MFDLTLYHGRAEPRAPFSDVSTKDLATLRVSRDKQFAVQCLTKAIPYCLDIANNRLIVALETDPHLAAKAPFHYQYLRDNCELYASLNWQQVSQLLTPKIGPDPILLYSPGRCGSTLATQMVGSKETIALSEPDYFTQIAQLTHAVRNRKLPGRPKKDIRNLSRALCLTTRLLLQPLQTHLPVLIKMRARANLAPLMLLQVCRYTQKTIFLDRDFAPWFRSQHKAFSRSLNDALHTYKRAQVAKGLLNNTSDMLSINYGELISEPLTSAARLARHLGWPHSTSHTQQAIHNDSQKNTPLARTELNKRDYIEPSLDDEQLYKAWQNFNNSH